MINWMKSKQACEEASSWVGNKTPEQAWTKCKRPDWMLWALGRTSIDAKIIVRLACDFALSVQHFNDDPRVSAAIALADRWASGDETIALAQLNAAYAAAYAAADAAYATRAAAGAADATDKAADAAAGAAYTPAGAVARAAYADMADLIRERVSPAEFARLVQDAVTREKL